MANREEAGSELVQTRVDPTTKQLLVQLADGDDRSLSSYVARVLKEHVTATKVPLKYQGRKVPR